MRQPPANLRQRVGHISFLALLLLTSGAVHAFECGAEPGQDKSVFWGDLHIHTRFSMDAYVFGSQVDPASAYLFAQGAPVEMLDGSQRRIDRPLDFAAVTDHAEYFGLLNTCASEQGSALDYCAELTEAAQEPSRRGFTDYFLPLLLAKDKGCLLDAEACGRMQVDMWQQVIAAAENANQPCRFTTFIGNEWSASPEGLHWHRNLIYASSNVPRRPINSIDEPLQTDLWRALDEKCAQIDGCDVLAIPHNGNMSLGGTFRMVEGDTEAMRQRAQFEKLVEVFQHKGASECYPGSLLSDEACGFEQVLPPPTQRELAASDKSLNAEDHARIAQGYARNVLARGLLDDAEHQINPFAYGFIGSTDTHIGRPGDVDEQRFAGHIGTFDQDQAVRTGDSFRTYNPGGLVAVWAEENTRAAIFDALQRRETYATSGPRIRLRFDQSFGTYASCDRVLGEVTTMGSVVEGSTSRTPTFIVRALKDKNPLERIDIIKLYLRDGVVEQAIYSFSAGKNGRADWCVTWQDPDYRGDEYALWYTRVLEVPSARWDGGEQIRERAWSSPIWSRP